MMSGGMKSDVNVATSSSHRPPAYVRRWKVILPVPSVAWV